MWFRFPTPLYYRIFVLRGFWILLIYFAFDWVCVATGFQGHTAHWAHIGGFVTGVIIGLALLISRKFDCRNGDLLSVLFGKYAWPLIGKPRPIERAPAMA
jgi:membrane associated rhomboid family serine protease